MFLISLRMWKHKQTEKCSHCQNKKKGAKEIVRLAKVFLNKPQKTIGNILLQNVLILFILVKVLWATLFGKVASKWTQ